MPSRERTLFEQAYRLDQDFPCGKTRLRSGRLDWTGRLTPTPLSREYTVRIRYKRGQYPQVTLIQPKLEPAERDLLHHLYPNGDLCLHRLEEWDTTMLLTETIVPWTSEWLAHYELWKLTHQWHGDGDGNGVTEALPTADSTPRASQAGTNAARRETRASGAGARYLPAD